MKFYHVPALVQKLFPQLVWRIETRNKELYLTFDDGPTGRLTAWINDTLVTYRAKATFFCVGENLERLPSWKDKLESAGHLVCNHTYNHVKGWETPSGAYMENIGRCERITKNKIFRPPYGQIKPGLIKVLKKKGFRIIMWDIMPYDFDAQLDAEISLSQIKKHAGPGSIIVFHDNIKAEKNLQFLLPRTLEYFSNLGYTFPTL